MTTPKTSAAKATKPAVKKPAATKAANAKAAKPVEVAATDGDACALPGAVTPATEGPKKRYRMLTGIDDSTFCQKVSDALDDGYQLYGSPTMTFNGTNVIVGQAVILKKGHKKGKRK